MLLAMTLVVRNEEEVLAANLDYHLAQGVDVILVVDHGSTDETPAILRRFAAGGRVRAWRDEERAHLQAQRVTRLLAIAREEHAASWVIHGDADEFWMPAAGSLRDVFAAVPPQYGYLFAQRHQFLPNPGEGPFHQRMTVRYTNSLNLRGLRLDPKVAQRPRAADAVAQGNHYLIAPTMEPAPDIAPVEVLHFQRRTFAQFEAKVRRGRIGYEHHPSRDGDTGWDAVELAALQDAGRLRAHFEREVRDARAIQHGLETGELLRDERLARFLANPAPAVESPAVQAVLRRAWLRLGEAEDGRRAAENRELTALREAEREREEAWRNIERERREAERLRSSLEAIRRSRMMRLTAPARRLYYRLRPRLG